MRSDARVWPSDKSGTQKWVPGISRKMALRQVEQRVYSFFCQIFAIFDDFSKFHCAFGRFHFEKIMKYGNILAKMNKTQKFGFGYPIHH